MGDFDPDAYLRERAAPAAGGGFDPDAYLKAKAAPPPPADTRNFLQRAAARVGEAAHTIGQGASTAGHVLMHPTELTDPAKRRELERGIDDMVTLGYGQKVADWAGRKLGDAPDRQIAATEAADAASAPGYRTAGSLAGGFMPGAASLAGKAGGKLAERALGGIEAGGAVSGAALGAARGAIGYTAGAVPLAAAQAAAHGENPLEAAKRAGSDPLGLGLALTGGAAAGGARGFAARTRDPATLSGRTIRDIQAAGGEVKAFGQPARGGLYETPELADLPEGRAGTNQLANAGAKRIADAQSARASQASKAWEGAAEQVLGEHGDKRFSTQSAHSALDAIERENVGDNGVVRNPKVAEAVARARAMLTSKVLTHGGAADAVEEGIPHEVPEEPTMRLDTGGVPHEAPEGPTKRVRNIPMDHMVYGEAMDVPAVTARDLIDTRKEINRSWRKSPEPADRHVFGKVASAIDEDMAAADPRLGAMFNEYRQHMQGLQTGNDALFGQNRARLKPSEAALAAGAGRLGRAGDETQAGTLADPRLARAAETSPQTAEELRLVRAKKAMERLRYGDDSANSTSMEKGRHNTARKVVKHAIGAGAGAALGSLFGPVGTGAGAAIGERAAGALDNPLATRVRLALPVADVAGRANGSGTAVRVNALTEAARKQRERKEAAARALLGNP